MWRVFRTEWDMLRCFRELIQLMNNDKLSKQQQRGFRWIGVVVKYMYSSKY